MRGNYEIVIPGSWKSHRNKIESAEIKFLWSLQRCIREGQILSKGIRRTVDILSARENKRLQTEVNNTVWTE
jgi:hypothetical protein